jgi:diacylglycerol kinase (ATP)
MPALFQLCRAGRARLGYNLNNLGTDTGSNNNSLPLVIVNPRSASGATRENWAGTAADLRAHFGPFNVAFTKAAGDGAVIAERAAAAGRMFIIACGGDGTVNEVANGIIRSGSDCELGVLPSGTGGDFRRTLGIPAGNREAAAALRDGITKTIDVGKVAFLGDDGEVTRYFVNVSSVGLAADVIRRVKSTRVFDWLPAGSLRGKANFALSTLRELSGLDAPMVRVRFDDGDEHSLKTVALCVCNARYFGGGMMIAPDAKLTDGFFDVINIGDLTALSVMTNVRSLYRGTHVEMKEVQTRRAKKIEIKAVHGSDPIHLETDGELPGRLPATYEILPAALRVRVP